MKKILSSIIVIFVLSCGIAHASVTSDTLQIQYNKCVKDLAVLNSLNYTLPKPTDPLFDPAYLAKFSHPITYEMTVNMFNTLIKQREDKKTLCESLASQLGINQSKPVSFPPGSSTAIQKVTPQIVPLETSPEYIATTTEIAVLQHEIDFVQIVMFINTIGIIFLSLAVMYLVRTIKYLI